MSVSRLYGNDFTAVVRNLRNCVIARLSHDSREIFVRASHDSLETFARVSHDVHANFDRFYL